MEGISAILEYFDKHIGWRNVAMLIMVIVGFGAGYYFCDSKREREKAELINEYTKEMKLYNDSATQAKNDMRRLETEYTILLWTQNKKIDSLQLIIKKCRNEE
ncbi:MAG: hypothetical protein K2K45_05165 [Muribaculaceae bacterium]|nr:hypothetical protein [Muribaculaceae bacterium]